MHANGRSTQLVEHVPRKCSNCYECAVALTAQNLVIYVCGLVFIGVQVKFAPISFSTSLRQNNIKVQRASRELDRTDEMHIEKCKKLLNNCEML